MGGTGEGKVHGILEKLIFLFPSNETWAADQTGFEAGCRSPLLGSCWGGCVAINAGSNVGSVGLGGESGLPIVGFLWDSLYGNDLGG